MWMMFINSSTPKPIVRIISTAATSRNLLASEFDRIGLVLNLDLVHAPFSIDVRAQDTMIVTMIALRPMIAARKGSSTDRALVALKNCHVSIA